MRLLLVFVFFSLFFSVSAQHVGGENDLERFEDRRRVFEHLMVHFDQNRAAVLDSLEKLSFAKRERQASERLRFYGSNDRLDTITVLNLSDARLTEFPTFVFEARNVERLILDRNNFFKLPGKLRKLKRLHRIDWSNDYALEGRISFPKLKSLKELDISNNYFLTLPDLSKLVALNFLDAGNNNLQRIPVQDLSKNSGLSSLHLTGNKQLKIQSDDYGKLSELQVLKLDGCNITTIDYSLYQIESLMELQLQENRLAEIPGGISALKHLSKISLYKNNLTDIPADFYELYMLEELDLYYNNIKRLDGKIKQLTELKTLYLSNNQIFDLPEEIGHLKKLTDLYLHHNKLSTLPKALRDLSSLKVLRLDHNYLLEFQNDFLYLTELTYLDISNNDIKVIPHGLDTTFPKMEILYFRENPIDFEMPTNGFIVPMISEMSRRGVVCSPSFENRFE